VSTTFEENIYKLLVNDDFINYIICPNLILNEMWNEFFKVNQEFIAAANEAKSILLGSNIDLSLSPFEMSELGNKILNKCA